VLLKGELALGDLAVGRDHADADDLAAVPAGVQDLAFQKVLGDHGGEALGGVGSRVVSLLTPNT
jgi:hypothetical protein